MEKKSTAGKAIARVMLPAAAVVIVYLYVLNAAGPVSAQTGKDLSREMLTEIQKERLLLEQERKRLEEYERNLKAFEAQLEQKHSEYLLEEKRIEEKEKIFNKRVQDRMVNRQIIDTYENIDPEQAAILVKNLYARDSKLTILILRKMSGRKAGKILEAMIFLDKELSTRLAQEILEYYKPG